MARPLRIDVRGGWYHVMSRGIERRVIFLDDSFCLHFLDLLGSMSERFGVEVHAYVLMGSHYLILHTPKPGREKIRARLRVLREHRWSSYRSRSRVRLSLISAIVMAIGGWVWCFTWRGGVAA